MRFPRVSVTTLAALLLAGAGQAVFPGSASAQYFGQNKVQYEGFDFEVLKTEHFDIHFYPEEKLAVEYAALMAERWYARLSRVLDHKLTNRQTLILYAAHPHFRQTNAITGVDEGTQGVTEALKRRIVLPFLGPLPETDHVIGHELAHAFQFDITGQGGGVLISGVAGALRMPLWFIEGMAEYLSVGYVDSETAMWMRARVAENLPADKAFETRGLHPYQHGQALWAYIAGRWGDEVVGRLLKAVRTSPSAGQAFRRVLRIAPEQLLRQWYEEMLAAAEPLMDQTEQPEAYGIPVLTKAGGSGAYNIGPALSPNGEDIVFLSEKDLFAIEMFLADAKTGKVARKIVKTAVDPHFEGLQFINSAGSWDMSGRRFAFAAVRKGQPAISVLNVKDGDVVHEQVFKHIGEIFSPAWAPDGKRIAFSAIVGGLSDLYIYNLETRELRRLTNDVYGDMQPAWSPDGQRIAFVTDRFTTGTASLRYGNYALAYYEVESGAIREVDAFDRGKHINPQWSPDGGGLYFVSDQNGISNIYRLDINTNAITQVTNLYTGIAGISPLSPAISIAANTGELAFSAFKGDAIEIYRIDDPEILAGGPVIDEYEGVNPAILPPAERASSEVVALLENPFFGLPGSDTTFSVVAYDAGLGLDYIGQPSLVVGADRYGTYIGGGTSLFWSDKLGGRNLATLFQINGGLKDISAAVAYTNLSHRVNWGAQIQQTTYLTGGFQTGFDQNGQLVDQQLRFRQTNRSLSGIIAYPFSRVQRIEFSAGVSNITFDYEVRTDILDPFTFEPISRETIRLPSPPALNLGQASAALVYDNSFYGIASPILGQRYRLEAAPTFGGLNMVTGIADFRKYIMPVRPFTLAGRLMHYGRYGSGSNDTRLNELFLGFPGLVRGYDYSSFTIAECGNQGGCPVFENLFGSKILLGNSELRFPPRGALGLGDGFFGFLPLEMGIFADAGIAWRDEDPAEAFRSLFDPSFNGVGLNPVYSAGVSFRFNLFGYAVLGLDWVHPFQRPVKGNHLQFTLSPGF